MTTIIFSAHGSDKNIESHHWGDGILVTLDKNSEFHHWDDETLVILDKDSNPRYWGNGILF